MDRDRAFEQRVARFVATVDGDPTLDEAALSIASLLRPTIDEIGVLADLDQLAADCPTPTRDGVINHLFQPPGPDRVAVFQGDRRTYHAWQNSSLDLVLRRRSGMPITLSVIAIEVARRVGVRLVGVGLPGHFIVGDPSDTAWYADPFHGLVGLGPDDCRGIVSAQGITRWSNRMLEPVAARSIVQRMLNNLIVSLDRAGDATMLAMVMSARSRLPDFADERADLGAALAPLN